MGNETKRKEGDAAETGELWTCNFCECRAAPSEFKKGMCPRCGRKSMAPPSRQVGGQGNIRPPENWQFFLDQYGDPCIFVTKEEHGPEVYPISSSDFKGLLYNYIHVELKKAPTSDLVTRSRRYVLDQRIPVALDTASTTG